MPIAPQLDPAIVAEQVNVLSRAPFRAVLARLLANSPSDGAIAAQAEAHPDRWGQTVALIARLGGFNDKLEVEGTLTHRVESLSDAELHAAIEAESTRLLDMQTSVRPDPRGLVAGPDPQSEPTQGQIATKP